MNSANVGYSYLSLNRLEEARTAAETTQAKKLDSPGLRSLLYYLAFLRNDEAGMAQQVAWAAGKPGVENVLLAEEASTFAYSGQMAKAREFTSRAVTSAERAEEKEVAAGYESDLALREALYGNAAEARRRATAALGLRTDRGCSSERLWHWLSQAMRYGLRRWPMIWTSGFLKTMSSSSTTYLRFTPNSR
jgi:hypothetical protein